MNFLLGSVNRNALQIAATFKQNMPKVVQQESLQGFKVSMKKMIKTVKF